MISIKNIHIEYDKVILENESIDIPLGKITLIEGKSGTGKTALLYRIGLISDDNNYIYRCNGTTIDIDEREQFRRSNIAFVLQDTIFFEQLTVLETIEYFAQLTQSVVDEQKIKNLLKKVKLDIDINQPVTTLSLGEKQRLAIITALLKNPRILILDEPTASLDQDNEQIILEIIQDIAKKGITVVMASHSNAAKLFSDVSYFIANNRLIKTKGNLEEQSYYFNNKEKIKNKFLFKYAIDFIKHHRFIYTFLSMILTISILSSNIFNIFITNVKEDSLEILEGVFDNKLVITQDKKNIFVDQEYQVYMSDCNVENSFPLYQIKAIISNQEIDIVPYFENDHLDQHLKSSFDNHRNGVYMDGLTYDILKKQATNQIKIIINDHGSTYDLNQEIIINGVMKDSYEQHYSSNSQRFIFMPYKMMKSLYESMQLSHKFIGYVVLYENFDDLKVGKNELEQQNYHINDSFTDIDSLSNIINYYLGLQLICETIIAAATIIIDIILILHLHLNKRKENLVLMISGLSKKHLFKIEIFEYLIEISLALFLSFFATSIILFVSNQFNFKSVIIILVIASGYIICLCLSRSMIMLKELRSFTMERLLRESEV